MKTRRSIVTLLAAGVLRQVLLVLLGTSLIQTLLFLSIGMNRAVILHDAFRYGWTAVIAGTGFVLMSIVLSKNGCETSSQIGLTLKRLTISEELIFWIQASFNAVVYALFWFTQIITAYLLAKYYVSTLDASMVTRQTIFLAFYRSSYLHSILPLDAVIHWIRNIVLLGALGAASAAFAYITRRGRTTIWIYVLILAVIIFFVRGPGDLTSDLILMGASMVCGLLSIWQMKRQEVLDDY